VFDTLKNHGGILEFHTHYLKDTQRQSLLVELFVGMKMDHDGWNQGKG
jgi:hypothetical protein